MATEGQKIGVSGNQALGFTYGGAIAMRSGQLNQESFANGIVAGTTRTQAGATALLNEINVITTSTAPAAGSPLGDGVILPASFAGADVMVVNATANPVQLYAQTGDTINGVAAASGVQMPPNSLFLVACGAAGSWVVDGPGAGAAGQYPTVSALDGMTAHPGGGQGSATQITTQMARFTTVASAGDSGILPSMKQGMQITVANAGAASMNVFPATGEQINNAGANAAYALAAGKTAQFSAMANGAAHALLSA